MGRGARGLCWGESDSYPRRRETIAEVAAPRRGIIHNSCIRQETKAMHDIPALQTLDNFHRLVSELNLKFLDESPLMQEVDIIREFYGDRESLCFEDREAKWQPRLDQFYVARG